MSFCVFTRTFGINGIFATGISSMSMRFHLSSTDVGFIRSIYDSGHLVTLGPLLYFGYRGVNRPMWIRAGLFAMAIASVLSAVPQLLIPPFVYQLGYDDRCNVANISVIPPREDNDAACIDTSIRYNKYVLMLTNLLYGMGSSPVNIFGLVYVDENVPPHVSSIYGGVLTVSALVGPAVGFLVGSQVSRIHGDVLKPSAEPPPMEPHEPGWYGAWWIGMQITAGLNCVAAVLVSGLPSQLPGALRTRMLKTQGKGQRDSESEERDWYTYKKSLVEVVKNCLHLLRCPYYVGLVINQCCHLFQIVAFSSFLPIYFEQVFSQSVSAGSMYGGIIILIGVISILVGTLLQNRMYSKTLGNIRFAFIWSVVTLVAMGAFTVHCHQYIGWAGISKPYPIDGPLHADFEPNLTAPCNEACRCSDSHFLPVCHINSNGTGHMTIFNKCFAGCKEMSGELVKFQNATEASNCDKSKTTFFFFESQTELG